MSNKVKGAESLYAKLKNLGKKHAKNPPSVVVGYAAEYAMHVHEDLEALHTVGQAKFLERPLKQHAKEMREMVFAYVKKGVDLVKALYMTGLFLQRKSQELAPVDTGNLKNSAFTEVRQS